MVFSDAPPPALGCNAVKGAGRWSGPAPAVTGISKTLLFLRIVVRIDTGPFLGAGKFIILWFPMVSITKESKS